MEICYRFNFYIISSYCGIMGVDMKKKLETILTTLVWLIVIMFGIASIGLIIFIVSRIIGE